MIDLKLCKKCAECTYVPQVEMGSFVVRPCIICGLTGEGLMMCDDPPDNCPYAMEHALVTQDMPIEFARSLSGRR